MTLSGKRLTIADILNLGADEIYSPVEILAIAEARDLDSVVDRDADLPRDTSFALEDLFAVKTKILRQIWLAGKPGVLPLRLMQRFALMVAEHSLERMRLEAPSLYDIRLTQGMEAAHHFLAGEIWEPLLRAPRQAVENARQDHAAAGLSRAAMACEAVHSAMDPDGHAGGTKAAGIHLLLFPTPEAEQWLRATLLALIRAEG